MNNRVLSLLAGLMVVLGLAFSGTVSAAPASGPTHTQLRAIATADYCADPQEQAFLTVINNYRAQNGIGPLVLTQTLGAAAKHHSIDMAENDHFSHTLSDGTSWQDNIRNHGYTFDTFMGENIAAGTETAAATFTIWQDSPPHDENMLSANFNAIGIGRAFNPNSTFGWYWTTTFGGVVDGAASLCGDPPPGIGDPPVDEPPTDPPALEVPEEPEIPEVPEVPDTPEIPEIPDVEIEVPQIPEISTVEVPELTDFLPEWDPRLAFIDVNPRLVAPSETLTLTGQGFAPGELQIAWEANGPVLAVAEVDENGLFSADISVPDSAGNGRYSIVVTDSRGTVKDTPVVVMRSWDGT